jgi:hypothetical protein
LRLMLMSAAVGIVAMISKRDIVNYYYGKSGG